jgi:hypothetical protein
MRSASCLLFLLVLLLPALACGGRVAGGGSRSRAYPTSCPEDSSVEEGASCYEPGLTCYGPASCDQPVAQCTCKDGVWTDCTHGGSIVSCEPPEAGADGEFNWDVRQPQPPEAGPPECPPPFAVYPSVTCTAAQAGLQCPGNQKACDGTVFYDALECNGSVWVTLAVTICGDDGGPTEWDAGLWEASDNGG